MKITNNSSKDIIKKDLKTQTTKTEKQKADEATKKATETKEKLNSNPNAQNIKDTNINIGRLQVAQKSLKAIESDVEKIVELTKDKQEEMQEGKQKEIQKEILVLRKKVESTMQQATFEGNNVFKTSVKNRKGENLFDASDLNMKLLDSDSEKFYDVFKARQAQVKNALQTLQEDAQANADKLAKNIQNIESTDSSFLKKFSSLFRVSHDTNKLDNKRVQELLS